MKQIHLIFILLLAACSQDQTPLAPAIHNNKPAEKIKWDNPTIMGGSNILAFFQACSNSQQYNIMASFTVNSIVERWGMDSVQNYYRKKDLGFHIVKLKSIINCEDSYSLLYLIRDVATQKQLTIDCKVINDTAKIVLPIQYK